MSEDPNFQNILQHIPENGTWRKMNLDGEKSNVSWSTQIEVRLTSISWDDKLLLLLLFSKLEKLEQLGISKYFSTHPSTWKIKKKLDGNKEIQRRRSNFPHSRLFCVMTVLPLLIFLTNEDREARNCQNILQHTRENQRWRGTRMKKSDVNWSTVYPNGSRIADYLRDETVVSFFLLLFSNLGGGGRGRLSDFQNISTRPSIKHIQHIQLEAER